MKAIGVLTVAHDALAVGIKGGKGVEWLECRPCSHEAQLPELADVLLARRELRAVRGVQVLLHPSMLQLRTLHAIPPIAQRQLPELIRANTKKFFRTNGSPLVVDACWTEEGLGERAARAAAASQPMIETLEAAVERTGARLLGISPGGSGPERGLSLETPQGRSRRSHRQWRDLAPYVIGAILAWATAGSVYVGDLVRDRAVLQEETDVLQRQVGQVKAVREEIARFGPIAEAVTAQGPDQAWATRRLAAVAGALPDSAHVLRLSARRDGAMRLDIRASDPVSVVEALSTALGEGASLEGPPREEIIDERHWYRIAVTLGGRNDRS